MSAVQKAPRGRDLGKQYRAAAKNLIYFEDDLQKELEAKKQPNQEKNLQNERIERFMNDDSPPQYKNAANMANKFSTYDQLQRGGIPELSDRYRYNIGPSRVPNTRNDNQAEVKSDIIVGFSGDNESSKQSQGSASKIKKNLSPL